MDILNTLDTIMPLELWGIALGIIIGGLLWMGFLSLMNWLNWRKFDSSKPPKEDKIKTSSRDNFDTVYKYLYEHSSFVIEAENDTIHSQLDMTFTSFLESIRTLNQMGYAQSQKFLSGKEKVTITDSGKKMHFIAN